MVDKKCCAYDGIRDWCNSLHRPRDIFARTPVQNSFEERCTKTFDSGRLTQIFDLWTGSTTLKTSAFHRSLVSDDGWLSLRCSSIVSISVNIGRGKTADGWWSNMNFPFKMNWIMSSSDAASSCKKDCKSERLNLICGLQLATLCNL